MTSLIDRAYAYNFHGKQLIDKENHGVSKLKRPRGGWEDEKKNKRSRVDSVRQFPPYCGLNCGKEEEKYQKSYSFATGIPPRIAPSCYQKNVVADIKEQGFNTAHSTIAAMNLNGGVLLNTNQFENVDGVDNSMKSTYDEDNDDEEVDVKANNHLNGKSLLNDDQAILCSITLENPCPLVQVEMPQRWEFEWVEVADNVIDDTDDISILSPLEWKNLYKNRRAKNDNHSKIYDVEDSRGVKVHATNAKGREKVQEVLKLYQDLLKNLSVKGRDVRYKGRSRNVHTKAAMILKNENKWVNIQATIGHISGVKIGDQFNSRVELAVVGLHHEFISGIDCEKMHGKLYAVSVVDSGRYENKFKSSNVLYYSGHGGNPKVSSKNTKEDQKLERGNLALKNSMDANFPVRVIRKIDFKSKKVFYIYDGLYNVKRFWRERSEAGKMIYMFEMIRIPDQPDCNSQRFNSNDNKPFSHRFSEPKKYIECLEEHERIVIVKDVSQGKENIEIKVVNELNDEKLIPFTYITKMVSKCLQEPSIPDGCDCINGCSDSYQCSCVTKNRGEIPFNEDGAILRAKKMVYECGPICKCPPSCQNRVTQHGLKLPLEVFKTRSTGWGVRSREDIKIGSFICEYLGELVADAEADNHTNDEYLFDLDDGEGFTIDAAKYGNVSRFINHSCSPNLYAQNVCYDHNDKRLPHIMFFATKNIPALQELTYHYNYKIGSVRDADGNIKEKKCYCGSRSCTGRLY